MPLPTRPQLYCDPVSLVPLDSGLVSLCCHCLLSGLFCFPLFRFLVISLHRNFCLPALSSLSMIMNYEYAKMLENSDFLL